ncbi:unnamed protein product [Phytophthora lilii]|uniref:Unnamed protein product n=1 Tax=Phytophthora lilii TaxID=2077276 RepID=A0A9W6WUU1_9STRA|nr:unnamed protein product [Phytophthora lilii]
MSELAPQDDVFLADMVGFLNSVATPRTSGCANEMSAQFYFDGGSPSIDELTLRLHDLRHNAVKSKRDASRVSLVGSHWAAEATRQRKERHQAEEERKRLMIAVNMQAGYVNELRAFAANQCDFGSTKVEGFATGIECRRKVPTLHAMTSVLYMTYLQQLEGCYARIDTIMRSAGVVSMPETTVNSIQRRKSDGEVAYFQHTNKVMLPYSYRQTCRALWKLVYQQDEPALAGSMAPDDDVFIRTRVLKAHKSAVLSQRCISRIYRAEERFIFIWKMSSEGEGRFCGLHADETGWMCLQPSSNGVQIEVCVHQVPMRLNLPQVDDPPIRQFYEVLQNSLDADKDAMIMALGKLLVEDVLAGMEC